MPKFTRKKHAFSRVPSPSQMLLRIRMPSPSFTVPFSKVPRIQLLLVSQEFECLHHRSLVKCLHHRSLIKCLHRLKCFYEFECLHHRSQCPLVKCWQFSRLVTKIVSAYLSTLTAGFDKVQIYGRFSQILLCVRSVCTSEKVLKNCQRFVKKHESYSYTKVLF